MKNLMAMAALVLALAAGAAAAVKTEVVEYKLGDTTLEGYLAYDDAKTGARPGVMIVHQWRGLTENEKMRARMLAELGYVALAVDVYGKGVRPATNAEAAKEAGKYYADAKLLRDRLQAGLQTLLANKLVDPKRVAAIGYCFGGFAALELARSGAPLAGVVSFHGGLQASNPADAANIKGKVLVCHGAEDPNVPMADVQAFMEEMKAANVDYQFIAYSGAVHSFTQKEAGDDKTKGAAYNANADRRSWQAMKDFFAEIF
ncbi:MAG: dienelactone hydrolase family protein [candidate division Zixibacteria bacterium]|nr:dienelactone hydrolase family protein [candidate division Zixibacteria bacterium]